MAKRFYTRDELERVKQSLDVLHDELVPAKHPGRGDKRRYVCPAPGCGKDGKVQVYRGNKDGAGIWRCFSCRAAGNVVDLYMVRDGLSRGEATTAVCDRWADIVCGVRPAVTSSVRQQRRVVANESAAEGLRRHEPSTAVDVAGSDSLAVLAASDDQQRSECRRDCMMSFRRMWDASGKQGLDYLHGRGYADETVRHFRLGYDAKCRVGGILPYGRPSIVIPYNRKMDYYAARFLRPMLDRDGKPTKILNVPGNARVFNDLALQAGFDALFVLESALDAIACWQAAQTISGISVGVVALGGANVHGPLIELLQEKPIRAGRLLIAFDSDEPGVAGAADLSSKLDRIGVAHELIDTRQVWGAWPLPDGERDCKDAGDVLQAYGTEVVATCLEAMLEEPLFRL